MVVEVGGVQIIINIYLGPMYLYIGSLPERYF